ncbi:MAG: hypothetical protein RL722_1321 [Pseudomonadota bacterium]
MDFSLLDTWYGRLALAAVVATLLLLWISKRRSGAETTQVQRGNGRTLDAVDTVIGWPPEATRVMTMRHRRAFDLLRRAVPECMVLAQIPLARFLRVPTRLSYVEWLRRVGYACVDLVVCDPASNVIAVIEVREPEKIENDKTRKRRLRVERVLRAAGIPLHVWSEAWLPDPLAVRRLLVPAESSEPLGASAGGLTDTQPQQLDPPRTSWFDDLNATRPASLDDVGPTPVSSPATSRFQLDQASALPQR